MKAFPFRAVVVIPAQYQAAANEWVRGQLGESGPTFVAGLSPTGESPATHYWCSAALSATAYRTISAAMLAAFPSAHLEVYDLDLDPQRPFNLIAAAGLRQVVEGRSS